MKMQWVSKCLIFRSNIVFTSIFVVEMFIKNVAYGPLGYIRDPVNVFDGVIVIISMLDMSIFL